MPDVGVPELIVLLFLAAVVAVPVAVVYLIVRIARAARRDKPPRASPPGT